MKMKQCSDSLIFLLIDDTISAPDFESQEEIEEYFGESVSFTIDDYNYSEQIFWDYLKEWESKHKFKVIQEENLITDRYSGNAEMKVIYTLDGKYYSIVYSSNPYSEDELAEGSKEVRPVEEVITRIKYVEV
jgi:hypothetical protein|nr:MAG TPA: hypothetical protein [Caudoviricetes sp.]